MYRVFFLYLQKELVLYNPNVLICGGCQFADERYPQIPWKLSHHKTNDFTVLVHYDKNSLFPVQYFKLTNRKISLLFVAVIFCQGKTIYKL